jgi:hypothetical protein
MPELWTMAINESVDYTDSRKTPEAPLNAWRKMMI